MNLTTPVSNPRPARTRRRFIAASTVGLMLISGIASADNTEVDGDIATTGFQGTLAFGNLCPSSTATQKTANWYAKRTGGNAANQWKGDQTLAFAGHSSTPEEITTKPTGGDAIMAVTRPSGLYLASAWPGLPVETLSSAAAGTVRVTPGTVPGVYAGVVKVTISGTNLATPTPGTLAKNTDLTVTWTVLAADHVDCAAAHHTFIGFESPVSNHVSNLVKAGQAVPLKFRILDPADDPVLGLTGVSTTVRTIACDGTWGDSSEVTESASGASGLQDLGDGYYQFNWKSAKGSSGCRSLRLNLPAGITFDGGAPVVDFQFK